MTNVKRHEDGLPACGGARVESIEEKGRVEFDLDLDPDPDPDPELLWRRIDIMKIYMLMGDS